MKFCSSSIETPTIFFGVVLEEIKVHKGNRGQLTVFMGISLILIMGMLAFIVNVGLFVKAKINLQNAVDAAAFSGAATQSRQLTNIAYANWELRNTYKEWMFKYYVLGQIGLFGSDLPNFKNLESKSPTMNFRLSVPGGLGYNAATSQGNIAVDAYNVPSVCIHNNTSKNICPLYMVPGLPRFKPIGVAGITEIHESIVNKLVNEKASDCSSRSNINYLAAINWTYGSGIRDIPGAPLIAANRPGAWPQALELAMRIRNLEMIVNRPPVTNGITINDVVGLENQYMDISLNERPVKAFWSAYRNLAGGKYKPNNDEFSSSFKLYEVPPEPFVAPAKSTSGFLIPDGGRFTYPVTGGGSALQKFYLDLQVYPVNYALMYSTFTSTKYTYEGVNAEASCGISKTAIPVPGYILGFVKNPQVLTYYAVKGEAKFIGLFSPFTSNGITLTAYSAAKPFGGRIGPRLFNIENNQTIKAREDNNRKSKPYISGLVAPNVGGAGFKVGYPIPYSQDFWASNAKLNFVLGGVPGTSAGAPSYGIPNLVYDFDDESDLSAQSSSTEVIQDIAFNNTLAAPKESLGLYQRSQFRMLRDSLGNFVPGTKITAAQITEALVRSRRATRYEAINYLIPDAQQIGSTPSNTPPFIATNFGLASSTNNSIRYKLFAPLSGTGLLYDGKSTVENVVIDYLNASDESVTTYLQSLLNVANSIMNTTTNDGGSGTGTNLLADAARSIHINAGTATAKPAPLVEGDCKGDIASKFNHFFRGKGIVCGIEPLTNLMVDYIAKNSNQATGQDKFYIAEYYLQGKDSRDKIQTIDLKSGYFPGRRQGSDGSDAGLVSHPLGLSGEAYSSRRNYYSTKFVQLSKLLDSDRGIKVNHGISDYMQNPTFIEGMNGTAPFVSPDLYGKEVLNPIKYGATSGIDNKFYLDF